MSRLVDPDLVPALAIVPDLDSLSDATLATVRASLTAEPPALGSDGSVTVARWSHSAQTAVSASARLVNVHSRRRLHS